MNLRKQLFTNHVLIIVIKVFNFSHLLFCFVMDANGLVLETALFRKCYQTPQCGI
jgi:hypothetical protein